MCLYITIDKIRPTTPLLWLNKNVCPGIIETDTLKPHDGRFIIFTLL